ncbi:MAG TPA: Crp/Fnr family transcriptional regulator [Gammaproteobacteria bacterium]|nr:Crp/Fnr family transcriptional regulator [Gammaproteobacteria bacterium]
MSTYKVANYCTDHQWKGRADCTHCGIRRLMLFSGLPESGFTELLQPIDNHLYRAGASLYEEGVRGQTVYSIRRGLLKLLYRTPEGSQRIVRLQGRGVTIGLELLDANVAYHHTAVAVQEVDACAIPLATLKNLQARFPALCDKVRQQLQQQVDRADQWIKDLNTGVSWSRVARLLLQEIGADRNGDIQLLPREDIAAVVGVTTETASRIVADFKRRGLLQKVAGNTYRCNSQQIERLLSHPEFPAQ